MAQLAQATRTAATIKPKPRMLVSPAARPAPAAAAPPTEGAERAAAGPFSESEVFVTSVGFYQEKGVNAWLDGPVPFAISNTRMLAKGTAAVLAAAFVPALTSGPRPAGAGAPLPFAVVEMGAGVCAFGYHLASCLADLELPVGFCVVMADISAGVVASRSKHPAFRTMLARGQVDFVHIAPDAKGVETARLLHRGCSVGELLAGCGAAAVSCNYLIDSLRSDLYLRQHEGVQPIAVARRYLGKGQPDPDPDSCGFEFGLVASDCDGANGANDDDRDAAAIYARPGTARALRRLSASVPAGSPFLFPLGAVEMFDNIVAATAQQRTPIPVLAVVSDKTCYDDDYLVPTDPPPGLARHGVNGCYSVAVNMSQLATALGASLAVHSLKESNIFESSTFLLGSGDAADRVAAAVGAAHRRELGVFGGGEWELLWTALEDRWKGLAAACSLSLGAIADLVNLSGWDYDLFKLVRWHARAALADADVDDARRQRWLRLGERCFARRYELSAATHVRHELLQHCRWLYSLGAHGAAIAHIGSAALTTDPRLGFLRLCCLAKLGRSDSQGKSALEPGSASPPPKRLRVAGVAADTGPKRAALL